MMSPVYSKCIVLLLLLLLLSFALYTGIRVHPLCSQGMILLTTTANGGGEF